MADLLDRKRLAEALRRLGDDLAGRGLFIEIAIYGGSAIMMQFEWRRSTSDVDAVVRQGYDGALLAQSVHVVAKEMELDPNWLNNAVGMFTPLTEEDAMFELAGHYPPDGTPGLRVLLARPRYLLAMKLKALGTLDRGTRDLDDAAALAKHLGVRHARELHDLYLSIHAEEPPAEARARFAAVLEP